MDFCTKSAQFRGLRNSAVSTVVSTPGNRNKRIGDSVRAPLKRKFAEDVFEVVGQVGGDDDLLAAARVDEFKLARVQALA